MAPSVVKVRGDGVRCVAQMLPSTSRRSALLALLAALVAVLTISAPAGAAWTGGDPMTHERAYSASVKLDDGSILIVGDVSSGSPGAFNSERYNPATGLWTSSTQVEGRGQPAIAKLADGRVLAASGNFGFGFSTSEIYDPATNTWTATGNMAGGARWWHSMITLADGRVFATGGQGDETSDPDAQITNSTSEIYDPSTGTWSVVAASGITRIQPRLNLLPDGRVLVTGNERKGTNETGPTAQIFDPAANTWTAATSGLTVSRRQFHSATTLPDGDVLVVGGLDNYMAAVPTVAYTQVERFDYQTLTWSSVAPITTGRHDHGATRLDDGRVLIAGGQNQDPNNDPSFASAEIYDPVGDMWASAGTLATARSQPHLHAIGGSAAVAIGTIGPTPGTRTLTTEVFARVAPGPGIWANTTDMPVARAGHAQTALAASGHLLVSGGLNTAATLTTAVHRYSAGSGTWSSSGTLATARAGHGMVALPDGRVLVAGGAGAGDAPVLGAELWDPATQTVSSTGATAGGHIGGTLTRLDDGRVLLAGGSAVPIGFDALGGTGTAVAEIYDPVLGSWSATSSMGPARTHHQATLLPDGRVFVSGGEHEGTVLTSTAIFDPATGIWTPGPDAPSARAQHTASLLPDGDVLVTGGVTTSAGVLNTTSDRWDDAAGWTTTAAPAVARRLADAVEIAPGRILVAGGRSGAGPVADTEVFDATRGRWEDGGPLADPHAGGRLSILPAGIVLVVGGTDGAGDPVVRSEFLGLSTSGLSATDDVPDTWRTSNPAVTLSALGGNGNVEIRYTKGTGAVPDPHIASTLYTGPVTLAHGERIKYLAADASGAVSRIFESTAAKVDAGSPSVGDNFAVGYQQSIAVTLTGSDGGSGLGGVYYYKGPAGPAGPYTRYTGPVTLAHGDVLTYFARDRAGNQTAPTSTGAAQIDTTAPVTADDLPADGFVTAPPAVVLAAADGASGVAATYYEKGTSPANPTAASTPYTVPVTLADGERIKYFSVDDAGNAEAVKTSPQVTVDAAAPTTADDVPGAAVGGPRPVTLTATDTGGSGVEKTHYTLDGSTPTLASPVYDSAAKPTLVAGAVVKYFSVDHAGNAETVRSSGALGVDATKPVTTDTVGEEYSRTPVAVTLAPSDTGGSGLAATYYEKGTAPGEPTVASPAYTGPVTLGDGERIRYFSIDHAGNAEDPHTSKAARVDSTPPASTDDVPGNEINGPYDARLSATDNASGVAAIHYTTGASPAEPTTSSPVYSGPVRLEDGERIRYFAIDAAGNAEPPHSSAVVRVAAGAKTPTEDVSVGAAPTEGTVTFTTPEGKVVELKAGAVIPLGSVIDTTKGKIEITAATDGISGQQKATFYDGVFQVTQVQVPGQLPITQLELQGELDPPTARLARASAAPLAFASAAKRGLWGAGKGRFRTKGKHGAATVRGTIWYTEDTFLTTRVVVKEGVVDFLDATTGKTTKVPAGKSARTKACEPVKSQKLAIRLPARAKVAGLSVKLGGRPVAARKTSAIVKLSATRMQKIKVTVKLKSGKSIVKSLDIRACDVAPGATLRVTVR